MTRYMNHNAVPAEDDKGVREFPQPMSVWDHIDIAMVRDRIEWTSAPMVGGHMIQLGAGKKIIDGWDNIEYPEWDAMATESTRWRIPYESESVGRVAIYHTLDHLADWAVVRALREIERVLEPGGVVTLIHPHYMGQLANECLMHKTRYAIDTWRNVLSERQYDHAAEGGDGRPWKLHVGANFIFGLTERNLVLVSQLHKEA